MMLMKGLRGFFIAVLLLCVVPAAFAGFGTVPSLNIDGGSAFCIPTASYLKEYPGDSSVTMPPVRTSLGLGLDADLLDLSYVFAGGNSLGLGLGLSYSYTSASLAYGISILKPYYALGFCANVRYGFDSRLSLALRYRFLSCCYIGTSSRFLAQDIELSPSYVLLTFGPGLLSVGLPVCVSIKADAVTVRAGVSLKIALDSSRMDFFGKEGFLYD